MTDGVGCWEEWKLKYPDKFLSLGAIFNRIHPGSRIFVGTGCGEPQYLVGALKEYVQKRPKALIDTEILHVWTLGIAPCAEEKFKDNFRLNSFFVGPCTRGAVNRGAADYTPIFLSEVPSLFRKGAIPIDVALIQTSTPDKIGYMSLGISVDIAKTAIEALGRWVLPDETDLLKLHFDDFYNHVRYFSFDSYLN